MTRADGSDDGDDDGEEDNNSESELTPYLPPLSNSWAGADAGPLIRGGAELCVHVCVCVCVSSARCYRGQSHADSSLTPGDTDHKEPEAQTEGSYVCLYD